MGAGEDCWSCTGRYEEATPMVTCDTCLHTFHEPCLEYYQQFFCPRCSEEPWVGAVEF